MAKQKPVVKVKELYKRLQGNALTSSDIISPDEVRYPDVNAFIEKLYRDKSYFTELFSTFWPTYDIFRMFTAPDQVVLDIGAHTGYSYLAMRHVGCGAKIVSADALPSNIEALAVLKKLSSGTYDYVHRAIGSGPGTLRLYLPVMNGYGITGIASTGGTLTDTFDGFAGHFADQAEHYPSHQPDGEDDPRLAILEIEAGCLDDIFEARGNKEVERIVGIKLDLEGHEGPALRGAERIFRRTKPLLMVEGANRDSAVVEAMVSYGYCHCERHESFLMSHQAMSMMNDGFWVHPERSDEYRRLGILKGELAFSPVTI
jgi:FkbM family methyltransferase